MIKPKPGMLFVIENGANACTSNYRSVITSELVSTIISVDNTLECLTCVTADLTIENFVLSPITNQRQGETLLTVEPKSVAWSHALNVVRLIDERIHVQKS